MWFLIKGTFWFSLVLVLLPFLDGESSDRLQTAPSVELSDTFTAASEALGYVSAICMEKPDVCEKGAETFVALGHRAREGAHVAYKFLDKQFADTETAKLADVPPSELTEMPAPAASEADDVVTGTIAVPTRRPDPAG
ncbi:DUF5330 domain-containing protein [Sinorhizobium sp. BG8]|uniref:DUF5330 domain-containing protein n=1 Tax=Sinorhizobium sp. BG8 TaxID=2613773 RepID=UPI00193E650E|nr:DUF5330 domain-containing protein [Sinorhizobium sp. BG8]QRM54695.1 hypothetical protein F3Y30_09185 [Sinorhizobium sp. BG8]